MPNTTQSLVKKTNKCRVSRRLICVKQDGRHDWSNRQSPKTTEANKLAEACNALLLHVELSNFLTKTEKMKFAKRNLKHWWDVYTYFCAMQNRWQLHLPALRATFLHKTFDHVLYVKTWVPKETKFQERTTATWTPQKCRSAAYHRAKTMTPATNFSMKLRYPKRNQLSANAFCVVSYDDVWSTMMTYPKQMKWWGIPKFLKTWNLRCDVAWWCMVKYVAWKGRMRLH